MLLVVAGGTRSDRFVRSTVLFPSLAPQTLHEELLYANFINPFRPGDAMTSMTYIHKVEQHPNGEQETQVLMALR